MLVQAGLSDLFGNHFVGFPTRRLIYLFLDINTSRFYFQISMNAMEMMDSVRMVARAAITRALMIAFVHLDIPEIIVARVRFLHTLKKNLPMRIETFFCSEIANFDIFI